ncbi:MAG: pyruvate dehydrogenase (acetyl-transferring) E1 component subunit alpha [Candidatus Aenigmarchaeota archaeon]|nr:pyruvate dehydrogenase (acetyl-transferring) E1 component subunit alpha [Candidatus Aenigmarchaeota archaeon]
MLKVVKNFSVSYMQVLDENGKIDAKLMPQLSNEDIQKMYEAMVLGRMFDETMLKLQREGRIGTYAPAIGQEATQTGFAYAMQPSDWFFPMYRDVSSYIFRGMPLENLVLYWSGDGRGMHIPEGQNNFPVAIPVSTQIAHAVGAAMAAKILGHKIATLVCTGDGGTSKADFHEALNFAGVFRAPVVAIVQNNQYAISMRREKQTAAETIAQKAIAYGFEGIQVDGNDVFAVYRAAKDALEKARAGSGPTLIECVTYRIADHTTADDAARYRTQEEIGEWMKKDPIERLRKYMESRALWSQYYEKRVRFKFEEQINDAIKKAENMPKAEIDDIFKHMYQEMTENLKEQLEELKSFLNAKKL